MYTYHIFASLSSYSSSTPLLFPRLLFILIFFPIPFSYVHPPFLPLLLFLIPFLFFPRLYSSSSSLFPPSYYYHAKIEGTLYNKKYGKGEDKKKVRERERQRERERKKERERDRVIKSVRERERERAIVVHAYRYHLLSSSDFNVRIRSVINPSTILRRGTKLRTERVVHFRCFFKKPYF